MVRELRRIHHLGSLPVGRPKDREKPVCQSGANTGSPQPVPSRAEIEILPKGEAFLSGEVHLGANIYHGVTRTICATV